MAFLLKRKLGTKIAVNTLAMLIAVSGISTVVVSVIIQRQNRVLIHQAMNRSADTLRQTLMAKQSGLVEAMQQMIAANKMGQDLNFLQQNKDSSWTSSSTVYSYKKMLTIIAQNAAARRLWEISLYDMTGNLVVGAVAQNKDGYRVGYQEKGKLYAGFAGKGQAAGESDYTAAEDGKDQWIELTYGGELPDGSTTRFENIAGYLCLKIELPVLTETLNPDTKKIEPIMTGLAVTVMRLDSDFAAWIKKLTGMTVVVFSGGRHSTGDLAAYRSIDESLTVTPAGGTWDLDGAESVFGSIELENQGYFQNILPIYNAGGFCGAVALLQTDTVAKANNRQMILILCAVSLGCMLLAVPLAWALSRSIVKPVADMVARIKDIADGEGDLTQRLTIRSADELGQLAQWFNTFIEKLQAIITQVKAHAVKLNDSSAHLTTISESLAGGAGQAADEANTVAASSEQMRQNMTSIAASMDQASDNLRMVATAAEEMSSTINEITQNTAKTSTITGEAVIQADKASSRVGELGASAREIGNVIESITEISEQVNLLALNATIEAARAGDAGKGFAVVANEIKGLAKQTAEATNEIKLKVDAIQQSTQGTVAEISNITSVVKEANEHVTTIASAVEEQAATTGQIAENVSQAAQGISEVNDHVAQNSQVSGNIANQIGSMTSSVNDISQGSSQVNMNSNQLSSLAEQLNALVGTFKV